MAPNTCQAASAFANEVFPRLDIRKEAGLDESERRLKEPGWMDDAVYVLFLGSSLQHPGFFQQPDEHGCENGFPSTEDRNTPLLQEESSPPTHPRLLDLFMIVVLTIIPMKSGACWVESSLV